MKLAIVECFFPELKGANIYRTGRGRASTSKAAISRAIADVFRMIKGKRVTSFRADVTVVDAQPMTEVSV